MTSGEAQGSCQAPRTAQRRYRERDLAGLDLSLALVSQRSPERLAAEQAITRKLERAYGAHLTHFLPNLLRLSVAVSHGRFVGGVFYRLVTDHGTLMAKKLKHEKELLKVALEMVLDDAVQRGIVEIEPTDSHDLKVQYVYRLLVHDKKISPLPNGQESLPKIRHRLAMWATHELPEGHELLS